MDDEKNSYAQNIEAVQESTICISSEILLSKNQIKRKRREEYLKEKKKSKKELEKIKKKENKRRNQQEINNNNPSQTLDEAIEVNDNNAIIEIKSKSNTNIIDRSMRKEQETKEFMGKCKNNFGVIIDCGWETDHSDQALKSLVQQLMYCYSCNKKHSNPCDIFITGLGSLSIAKLDLLHYQNWNGVKTFTTDISTSIINNNEIMNNKELIYLTSDSDNLLETLDSNCIYIIGGIVDRNRLKGATLKKANDLKIKTAKLPIKEYFSLSATHILTVNHVFEILLNFSKFNDWKSSMESVLPKRKCPSINNNNNNNNNDKNDDAINFNNNANTQSDNDIKQNDHNDS